MKVWVAGAWRDILTAKLRMSGAWRPLLAVKIFDGGVWRDAGTFEPPATSGGSAGRFRLSVGPILSNTSRDASTITSVTYIARPSSGTAPFSYAWSLINEDGDAVFTINAPTLAQTTVTGSGIANQTQATCGLHCICTDAVGNVASATASVSLTNTTI
jgi:hypothetical protein